MAAEDHFAIETPAGRIVGRRSGSGPPALVLHGGPGLSDYTEELADELADVLEVFRYEQRGLSPTTIEGPYTVEAHVGDALAVIDGLGLDRPLLVGHSWGGHLAMHLAAAAPLRVAGAVIVDPLGAVPDGGERELEENLMARLPAEEARRVRELERRIGRGEGGEADDLESLRILWPYYFSDPETAHPVPPLRISLPAYAGTFASVRGHFERGTLVAGLPRFAGPMLFLHGRDSPIPWRRSEESAELVADARLEIVDRCGHFPWLEAPGCVRDAIVRAGLLGAR
jgi:proline iminopeptidase